MSGSKIGGAKAAKTNKAKYGDNFYSVIGRQGGSVTGIKKGFALMTPEARAAAGRKGGTISKRTKKVEMPIAEEPIIERKPTTLEKVRGLFKHENI